jgi:hypothetical protein
LSPPAISMSISAEDTVNRLYYLFVLWPTDYGGYSTSKFFLIFSEFLDLFYTSSRIKFTSKRVIGPILLCKGITISIPIVEHNPVVDIVTLREEPQIEGLRIIQMNASSNVQKKELRLEEKGAVVMIDKGPDKETSPS